MGMDMQNKIQPIQHRTKNNGKWEHAKNIL